MNASTKKRAAILLRVSTGEQHTENQVPDVERLLAARGFVEVARYVETVSTRKHRPEFKRMMDDARRGMFDVLVIWALDRLGRDTIGNMLAVRDLDAIGVQLVSAKEVWLDTTGPTRTLLVAIFSWVAEQERDRRSERTKAGLARVRAHGSRSGKPIGRPPRLDAAGLARVRELAAQGRSVRSIAMAVGVPRPTVQRALAPAPGASRKGGRTDPPPRAEKTRVPSS
jgi:putative DNA-invertase from lambdoid prophage Rac